MTFERYLEAERRLNEGLIRLDLSLRSADGCLFDPAARMPEMERFLGECGNPQRGIPAVHVAGTSGKGSVAAGVAGILAEAGLRTGLHVSPYVQVATEKIWINGCFVAADDFADLVDWVAPLAAGRLDPAVPASVHGMASVALAFEAFRRARVDVMVIEVGCGGRYDLTSFVDTKVAVVTNVGLDHVGVLGDTIERIAWHKAGVARPGAPLVTGASGAALAVVEREAEAVRAPVIRVPATAGAISHNRALAAEAAQRFAAMRGVALDDGQVARGLDRVRLAGRSEVMPGQGPRVVLDGAHNPDKLRVAVDAALAAAGPGPEVAVVGILKSKRGLDVAAPFAGRFDRVIATEPRVYGKPACPASQTAALFARAGCRVDALPDPFAAVSSAIAEAGSHGTVLVTGSFYLVGEVRERWYSRESVVTKRTSFPHFEGKHSAK